MIFNFSLYKLFGIKHRAKYLGGNDKPNQRPYRGERIMNKEINENVFIK